MIPFSQLYIDKSGEENLIITIKAPIPCMLCSTQASSKYQISSRLIYLSKECPKLCITKISYLIIYIIVRCDHENDTLGY